MFTILYETNTYKGNGASKCPSSCVPGTCTGAGERPPQFQQPLALYFFPWFLLFW
ncbi:hypothetical protein ACRRTK_006060 [Alexandromys fortis]